MTPSKGYYSLIQYCPDLSKLEAANVGVMLFCPERAFLRAQMVRGNRRIIRIFGSAGHDWERINAFKKGLADRLELEAGQIGTLEDLRRFIAGRANLLQITEPRPMRVDDPKQELEQLFQELIGDTSRRAATSGIRRIMAKRFESAGLHDKIQHNIAVTVPVVNRPMEVPFGFQNGRFNLITPVKFETAKQGSLFRTACMYALEGKWLYEHGDPTLGQLQLVVVGKFRPGNRDSADLVRRVLDDSAVKLYPWHELSELIEEIRRTGKPINSAQVS